MTAAIRPPDRAGTDMQQDEVIGFLRQPGAYPQPCHDVRIIETHAALVFLAGSNAYKIKKAVTYPYLDFSTLAKREAACRRELEINQPHAPQIYLGIVPVCRTPDGELAIGGTGKPVEWTVHMHRFDDDALLAKAIDADPPGLSFYDQLADEIASYHAKASVIADRTGAAAMQVIVDELREAFASAGDIIGRTRQAEFDRLLSGQLDTCRHRLDQRARRGYLRRCHGDLHLGNIVVLNGRPVLFDAIEFSEEFASIDTLYDLAFLIMDLDKRGMRPEANR
ncbi:MAG: hypothetical protein ACR2OM_05750, partial [Aestuariivirgaceae bacterium]